MGDPYERAVLNELLYLQAYAGVKCFKSITLNNNNYNYPDVTNEKYTPSQLPRAGIIQVPPPPSVK